MQRFLLFLILILNINISSFSQDQITPSFVRFDPPSFVPVNTSFSTSVIFKLDVLTDKSVVLRFLKPNSLSINVATLKSIFGDKRIPISFSKDDRNELTMEIDAEEFALDANYPYQIILDCFTRESIKIDKNLFSWIDEKLLKIADNTDSFSEPELSELNIYDVQNTSGKSISLRPDSKFSINLKESLNWKKLYYEFWLKTNDNLENFLIFKNPENGDSILSISKNNFGFISSPISNNELHREDYYLGENCWNYVGIQVINESNDRRINVFVNSMLTYSQSIDDQFAIRNLNFEFNNSSDKSIIELDRIKLWNFENNLSLAENNKHFLSYDADSSQIIYQTNFNNSSELETLLDLENLNVKSENVFYNNSDAPIFSKAPKLTVNIGSAYNSIVWYVQEYSFAKEFEIEKAIGDDSYQIVFSTLADEDPLKIYYFTDELINVNEVAYYRVKQKNQDGSTVYSPEVKVGHKEIQEFSLSQNYPNPFNPITSIYVNVILPTEIKVNVYDLVGNTVAELYDGYLAEGMHTFDFDGSNLPSGIYFYEVISPKSQSVKKMILAK